MPLYSYLIALHADQSVGARGSSEALLPHEGQLMTWVQQDLSAQGGSRGV